MNKEKILIVDDEKHIRRLVGDYLTHEGFTVDEAEEGQEALEKLAEDSQFDLVLLDIRMPKMDGFETLQRIRSYSEVPVIFLTALDNEKTEIQALNDGAVDYITKPFSFEVLIARITNFLKRNRPSEMEKFGRLSLDRAKSQVYIDSKLVDLTQKEFDILEYLSKNSDRIFSRDILLDRIWGISFYGDERTVDTHIKTLRKKLEDCGSYIKTKRGMGYYFEIN
ncbi:MAG: response regulator transcription factor [Sphaerochaeta sp.]